MEPHTEFVGTDTDYLDDEADEASVAEELPEPTDPSQVPPDQGDCGAPAEATEEATE